MMITHETTIEEYEAWIATNPEFTAFKVAVRSIFRSTYRVIGNVKRGVSRLTKKRSCLAGKMIERTIYPFTYNKNGLFKRSEFYHWLQYIRHELAVTAEHIRLIEQFDCLEDKPWAEKVYHEKYHRIARIEDEICMEGLKVQALEIINKK